MNIFFNYVIACLVTYSLFSLIHLLDIIDLLPHCTACHACIKPASADCASLKRSNCTFTFRVDAVDSLSLQGDVFDHRARVGIVDAEVMIDFCTRPTDFDSFIAGWDMNSSTTAAANKDKLKLCVGRKLFSRTLLFLRRRTCLRLLSICSLLFFVLLDIHLNHVAFRVDISFNR